MNTGDLPPDPPPGEPRPPDPGTTTAPRGPFSAELKELAARYDHQSARLSDLFEATRDRGCHLLLFAIALPFVGPIPLPGFSLPFGAAIALIGAGMTLNRPAWLPGWLLRRRLPAHALARALQGASRIVAMLERFTRPRLSPLVLAPGAGRFAGILIVVSGLFMILPFPLPFSNSLPAWTVLLLAAGSLAGDGVFLLAGLAAFLLTVAFFTFVFVGGGKLLAGLLAG